MTRTVSNPQRLPTVRTRPTNWIAVLAIGLMSLVGCVAKADAAAAHRTRAKSTSSRKGTAVKARPRAVPRIGSTPLVFAWSARGARVSPAPARRARSGSRRRPRGTRPMRQARSFRTSGPLRPSSTTPRTGRCSGKSNSQDKRSIASITKVMTAAGVPRRRPRPHARRSRSIAPSTFAADHTYLRADDRVTVDDLLHLTLIASDNAAARALARTSPDGPAASSSG